MHAQWKHGNGNLYVGGYFDKIDTTTVNMIACYGDSCPGSLISLTLPYGLKEFNIAGVNFKIYPNPTKKNITIEAMEDKVFMLSIFSPIGQTIIKRTFQKKIEADVSVGGKGLFLVEVCNEAGTKCHTQRVILE